MSYCLIDPQTALIYHRAIQYLTLSICLLWASLVSVCMWRVYLYLQTRSKAADATVVKLDVAWVKISVMSACAPGTASNICCTLMIRSAASSCNIHKVCEEPK